MSAASVVAALTRRRPEGIGVGLDAAPSRVCVGTGAAALDAVFDCGGLPVCGAHEISAAGPGDGLAAALFAFGLASRLLDRRPGRNPVRVRARGSPSSSPKRCCGGSCAVTIDSETGAPRALRCVQQRDPQLERIR